MSITLKKANGRNMAGRYRHAGTGLTTKDLEMNAYGKGKDDKRRVSAKVIGVQTVDVAPESSAVIDGTEKDVDIGDIRTSRMKFTRGKLAQAREHLKDGVKGSEHGVEPITVQDAGDGKYVVVPGKGDHRLAALHLEGHKGTVKVLIMKKAVSIDLLPELGTTTRGDSMSDIASAEPMAKASLGMTSEELRSAIAREVREYYGSSSWVLDVYPETHNVIITTPGATSYDYPGGGSSTYIKIDYEIENGEVVLGDEQEVERDWAVKNSDKVTKSYTFEKRADGKHAAVIEGELERSLCKAAIEEAGYEAAEENTSLAVTFGVDDAVVNVTADAVFAADEEPVDVMEKGDSERLEKMLKGGTILTGTSTLEKAAKRGLVTLLVYSPNSVDLQGEYASAEDIEKAAHDWLAKSRTIKINHATLSKSDYPVESWLTKAPWTIGGKEIPEGSWCITVQLGKASKEAFEKGALTGASMGGEKSFADEEA